MKKRIRRLEWLIAGYLLACWLIPAAWPLYAANADDLIFQGADHHYKGNLDLAVASFQQAVRLDPKNDYAHNQLGVLYAKKEKFDLAFQEFSTVVSLESRNTFARLWLGILELRNGRLAEAFDQFTAISRLDPGNADAYYFMGAVYNFQHNPVVAIEFLKKARDADSDEADTHFRLGKAFHNLDMHHNALLEYHRTIEIKPNHTPAINEIGWIYYNQGEFEKAEAQWKKTLSINNRDQDAPLNLAKIYNDRAWSALEAGNRQEAVACWRKAARMDPGNKQAKYYLEKYAGK